MERRKMPPREDSFYLEAGIGQHGGAFEWNDTHHFNGKTKESIPTRAPNEEVLLFFLAGVGSTIGWTAVLSNIVFYTENLGKASYIILNMAVYFPMLPITLAQARWDSYIDRRYNSHFAYSARGTLGFSLATFAILYMPLVSHDLTSLSVLTTLLGTASAVLHGTCKQMASFVYPNCKRLPAAVTCGMQASAALVLIVSLSTGFGSSGDARGLNEFYLATAALLILCWVSFVLLVSHSNGVLRSLKRRDSSFHVVELPLLQTDAKQDMLEQDVYVNDTWTGEMNYTQLWTVTWKPCIAIMITVGSSMSVSSWFSQIQSADPATESLPQVLFYTRLFADLLARPATLVFKPPSLHTLGILSWLRVILFVPIFFVYVSSLGQRILPRSDLGIIIGVALFAFSSGYIATACYQVAPDLLQPGRKGSIPNQANLINVCFSASIVLGVTASFVLLDAGLR